MPAAARTRPRVIRADGRWHAFHVGAPEESVTFRFEVVSGCRYRVTAASKTLPRVLLTVGPGGGDRVLYRADSGAPTETRTEASGDRPRRPESLITWYAENDDVLEAHVRGFSVLTGTGRLRLETLGPGGARVKPHLRILAPGATLAQVGALWVAESNRWELHVLPGRTYEVAARPGTADRIRLAVVGAEGETLARAEPAPGRPYPSLRFTVPLPPGEASEAAPAPWQLEVEAAAGGGGTYGVRLVERPQTRTPTAEGPRDDIPTVRRPRRPVRGTPLAFEAEAGDLAFLFVPTSHPANPHRLQVRGAGGRWADVPPEPVTAWGRRASMQTPERSALVWFRAHRAGSYRFLEARAEDARLQVHDADRSGGGPLLVGTGLDPIVYARSKKTWRTIGVGVCMPGFTYLFVAVHRRPAGLKMRVTDVEGEPLVTRTRDTRVAGMGPSLRFRVGEPRLVRLQVKGKAWEGYALLRRASN